MRAADIMTRNVVSVAPETPVVEVARLLLERRISAVPVVDARRRVVGIIGEGDLIRKAGNGTAPGRSWWLGVLVNAHGPELELDPGQRIAAEVMSRDVVMAETDTPLPKLLELLSKPRIKRLPVVENGRLLGIVSRVDLLRALASRWPGRRETG